jgi:hypothetical protein
MKRGSETETETQVAGRLVTQGRDDGIAESEDHLSGGRILLLGA